MVWRDRGGERPEAGVGRKVGHVVFLLARRSALADEPEGLTFREAHRSLEAALDP
jgi:hypothetical protein